MRRNTLMETVDNEFVNTFLLAQQFLELHFTYTNNQQTDHMDLFDLVAHTNTKQAYHMDFIDIVGDYTMDFFMYIYFKVRCPCRCGAVFSGISYHRVSSIFILFALCALHIFL